MEAQIQTCKQLTIKTRNNQNKIKEHLKKEFATDGGRIVPESITSPVLVVSTSVLT